MRIALTPFEAGITEGSWLDLRLRKFHSWRYRTFAKQHLREQIESAEVRRKKALAHTIDQANRLRLIESIAHGIVPGDEVQKIHDRYWPSRDGR